MVLELKMHDAEIAPPFTGCRNSNGSPNFSLCDETCKYSVENHCIFSWCTKPKVKDTKTKLKKRKHRNRANRAHIYSIPHPPSLRTRALVPCLRTTWPDDSWLSPVHLVVLLLQFQLFCLGLWNPDLFTGRTTLSRTCCCPPSLSPLPPHSLYHTCCLNL